jgi:DNA replication licensing factor MCM4
VNSKYDPKLSVVENIKLPPTLLSRFDLIYLVLDKQSDTHDRRLANHIVSLYSQLKNDDILSQVMDGSDQQLKTNLIKTGGITRDFFAAYISYARRFVQPKIPDYVVGDIVQNYVNMRNMGNSKKTITATPRQLESMIRLAESIAKMRLSETVERSDVEEALRLIKTAMQQSATDPTTGEIDMDIIATGISSSTTEKVKGIMEIVKNISVNFGDKVRKMGINYYNLSEFVEKKLREEAAAAKRPITDKVLQETELREALRQLEEDNVIQMFGNSRNPVVRFIYE